MAFERVGGRCVFSSDCDKFSQQTYEANFGERPHGDSLNIAVEDIPDHDILCGGFPCQPFSIAGVSKKLSLGRKHGFEDVKQGNLFFSIAAILDFHRPAAFVLENVKNLKGHDGGKTFEIIYRTLTKELGYTVYHKIIDAQSVVPQHRERIFLVGFRDYRHFEFPKFPVEGPKLGSILERKPDTKYTLSAHLWNYLQNYAAKHRAAGNGFGFGLVTEKDTTRTLSARYHKDGSEILIAQKSGRIPRRLTPRECARLMGYPESFKIVVSDTQAYRQFGNSVVVPVVERIATLVFEALNRPAWKSPDPDCGNKGVYWVKNGPDKCRVQSPEELARLFQAGEKLYAEGQAVAASTLEDFDHERFNRFYDTKYSEATPDRNEDSETYQQTLENLELVDSGRVTVAGLLLFGKRLQTLLPEMKIDAVWFKGTGRASTDWHDQRQITGTLAEQFDEGTGFLKRWNSRSQGEGSFNQTGSLEISETVFEELLVNSLIHRDYSIKDSIKLFIFDDRIEIRSPGKLPNSLTVGQIRRGVRRSRNVLLASFAPDLLNFRGIGSGIVRALKICPSISWVNDMESEEVAVTIPLIPVFR